MPPLVFWRRHSAMHAAGLAAVVGLAFVVGYWNQSHSHYAQALAALPLVVVAFCRPQIPLALGVAALPLMLDVVGGAVHLTAADVLMTFALAAALPVLLLRADWAERARDAGPLLAAALPFTTWLALVTVHHGGLTNAAKTGQYYQLFLVPLLLGAMVIEKKSARVALTGFVASAVLVALLWATTQGHFSFAQNKNPSGQIMTDAIILTLALAPSWLWRLVALLPLLAGLGFTQSRGAILAAGVGVGVLLALRGLGSWRKTVAAVLPLLVGVLIGWQLLPEDVQSRATDFSSGSAGTTLGSLTSAQYTLRIREVYRANGWKLVNSNPVFGVGPGNYTTGAPGSPYRNTDPHDLIIRTAGDSGYPGLVAFGILVVATAVLVLRRRNINRFAVIAIAMQAALITHGFFDVYWVRTTPVIGWLLVGMALNRRLDEPREQPGRGGGGVSQRRAARSLPVLTPPRPAGVGDRQLR